jgi:curved DNA-binding protein CbpA
LSVGDAARLLGDSVIRAARERGGELRAAYDALSDPDFAAGLDWRTLQDRKTGRVRRNIRWERAGSRRRVEPTGVPVPRSSWDGVEARAAVRRARHDVAVSLARLARAVNSGVDPLDDERV